MPQEEHIAIGWWDGGAMSRRADWIPRVDPAEDYHEASKLHPGLLRGQMPGVRRLEARQAWQRVGLRAGKRFDHLPACPLPPPSFPRISFDEVLRMRRSARTPGGGPIAAAGLSTLLHAAQGITRRAAGAGRPDLRSAPSAGALYPLDVYLAARRVRDLPAGLYHYDPDRHAVVQLRPGDPTAALRAGLVEPAIAEAAAAVIALVACFPRSRVKYGLRAYRFTLLEAGHVAQNVLLAAAALGFGALPVGGFFDRRIEEMLAVDGLHESPLYLIAVGSTPEQSGTPEQDSPPPGDSPLTGGAQTAEDGPSVEVGARHSAGAPGQCGVPRAAGTPGRGGALGRSAAVGPSSVPRAGAGR